MSSTFATTVPHLTAPMHAWAIAAKEHGSTMFRRMGPAASDCNNTPTSTSVPTASPMVAGASRSPSSDGNTNNGFGTIFPKQNKTKATHNKNGSLLRSTLESSIGVRINLVITPGKGRAVCCTWTGGSTGLLRFGFWAGQGSNLASLVFKVEETSALYHFGQQKDG